MSESILYYPTIDIQDGPWLRSAALYWDEVCSIVPDRNYVDISPELLYLQERGYYRPIYPADVFLLGDPDEFSNAVIHQFAPRLKKKPFSFFRALRQRHDHEHSRRRIYDPSITSLIHYRKMPEQVMKLFADSDMVVVHDDGWLEMDDHFADRYMRLLAEFVIKCDRKDMVLGSDKVNAIREVYPKPFRSSNDCRALSLTLEKCLPIPAEDVGFEALLAFKEERKTELLSLQQKIAELEERISRAEDAAEMKRIIVDFRQAWEREVAKSEKLFRSQGIRFALGSLRSFIQGAGEAAGIMQGIDGAVQDVSAVFWSGHGNGRTDWRWLLCYEVSRSYSSGKKRKRICVHCLRKKSWSTIERNTRHRGPLK